MDVLASSCPPRLGRRVGQTGQIQGFLKGDGFCRPRWLGAPTWRVRDTWYASFLIAACARIYWPTGKKDLKIGLPPSV